MNPNKYLNSNGPDRVQPLFLSLTIYVFRELFGFVKSVGIHKIYVRIRTTHTMRYLLIFCVLK